MAVISLLLTLFLSLSALAMTEAELTESARKEGSVHVLTNGTGYGKVLVDGFRKRYPFLKVKHTTFAAAPARYFFFTLMEHEQGDKRADVVLRGQERDLLEWKGMGWLGDLSGLPNWDKRPRLLEDDKEYVYFLGSPHVVFWNSKMIKESELPKSYDELLEPKWNSRVAFRSPLRGNSSAMFSHYIKDTRDLKKWFFEFGKNKPFIGQTGWATHAVVQQGKYPIGISRDAEVLGFAKDLMRKEGKVSLLKYKILEQDAPYQLHLGLVNKAAANPHAAKLFLNWVLSEEGTELLEKAGYAAGKHMAADLQRKGLWQWNLTRIPSMFSFESTITRAFRGLKQGGARIQPEPVPSGGLGESCN